MLGRIALVPHLAVVYAWPIDRMILQQPFHPFATALRVSPLGSNAVRPVSASPATWGCAALVQQLMRDVPASVLAVRCFDVLIRWSHAGTADFQVFASHPSTSIPGIFIMRPSFLTSGCIDDPSDGVHGNRCIACTDVSSINCPSAVYRPHKMFRTSESASDPYALPPSRLHCASRVVSRNPVHDWRAKRVELAFERPALCSLERCASVMAGLSPVMQAYCVSENPSERGLEHAERLTGSSFKSQLLSAGGVLNATYGTLNPAVRS